MLCISDCSTSEADIVFVVDDSTSVGRLNYKQHVLPFVSDVVNSLTIGPNAVQVAFISFSNIVKTQFYLNTYSDNTALLNKINSISHRGGGTNIARALSEAKTKHFEVPSRGVREASAKVLVLITDGTSGGTDTIAAEIREAGITILCVGITSYVDLSQLEVIAGDVDKVFDASSFSELANIKTHLINRTCQGTRIVCLSVCLLYFCLSVRCYA